MAKKSLPSVGFVVDKSVCNRDTGIDQQQAMWQAKQQMKDCMRRQQLPAYDKIMNTKYKGD